MHSPNICEVPDSQSVVFRLANSAMWEYDITREIGRGTNTQNLLNQKLGFGLAIFVLIRPSCDFRVWKHLVRPGLIQLWYCPILVYMIMTDEYATHTSE